MAIGDAEAEELKTIGCCCGGFFLDSIRIQFGCEETEEQRRVPGLPSFCFSSDKFPREQSRTSHVIAMPHHLCRGTVSLLYQGDLPPPGGGRGQDRGLLPQDVSQNWPTSFLCNVRAAEPPQSGAHGRGKRWGEAEH